LNSGHEPTVLHSLDTRKDRRHHGLLVDKVEVAAVDLRGAMEKANNRVLKIVNAAQIGDSGEGDSQTGSV